VGRRRLRRRPVHASRMRKLLQGRRIRTGLNRTRSSVFDCHACSSQRHGKLDRHLDRQGRGRSEQAGPYQGCTTRAITCTRTRQATRPWRRQSISSCWPPNRASDVCEEQWAMRWQHCRKSQRISVLRSPSHPLHCDVMLLRRHQPWAAELSTGEACLPFQECRRTWQTLQTPLSRH
jgi:hypothetical protein